ncbi:Dor1-domain-containing protein [Laetiporus sulphureus 93-53]|uniref:Conserved oligomeric Golgi complex subunit 8 n=1 Tax=Laetiporus sulphureus 93-53 TaxID=1314785 RepID=A0A165FDV4_9APHY|nr:Dor1-domain-containing protein [Laetiporus sulphureus 93-53]KZT08821.1 Dor1-domain-containing protein [Laetiporus sulphureus 93-53]
MADVQSSSLPPAATSLADIPTLSELLASSSTDASSSSTLASRDAASYLAELTSLPLAELEAQPTELSSSSAQLTNALTTLCYTSYPTFLLIHATTSTFTSSLSSLSSSLDALISSLPALENSARSFAEDTREIQKERRKAALVLEHHDKLYDVLSLPLLLDSCVRNHNYTDALLLANHSNSLSQRFPSNPLVQSVKAECDARVQAMLGQLLRMLSEQAKLPALFRAAGFLRKMGVLTEPELALAFLTGRGTYLESLFKTIDIEKKAIEGDRDREMEAYARYLKKYVDLWREGVYDVITQYTTIFLDRAPSISPDVQSRLRMLLTTFTTLRLQNLLSLLRDTLPYIPDPSLLTSLLTQLTYCANSFARVGMDFRALLAPIFVDAVRSGVKKEFEEATKGWSERLRSCTESGTNGFKANLTTSSQILVASTSLASPPLPTKAQLNTITSGPPNVPPPILVSYPPLAIYTNAFLTALNGLRMLAPVELLDDLLGTLERSLAEGLTKVLALARDKLSAAEQHPKGGEEEERKDLEVVRAAGMVYVEVFVPFLRRALVEGVYGVVMKDKEIPMGKELRDTLEEWKEWVGEKEEEAADRVEGTDGVNGNDDGKS